MKRFFGALLSSLVVLLLASHSVAAMGQYTTGTVGVDVSYPNCKSPVTKAAFGIVGVNGGKPFLPNNCLAAQAAKFKNLSLYVNTAYPGQNYGLNYQNYPRQCLALELNCLAYNYGYNGAMYAYNYAINQGVTSETWWLDVETMNSWTGDFEQNKQSLQGQIDYLKTQQKIPTVGIYSTTYQWGIITGGWQNNLPSWGATTWATAKQAMTYCKGHEFTGGPSYLMQFQSKSVDQDVAC